MSPTIPTVKVTFLLVVATPELSPPPSANRAKTTTTPVTAESGRRPGKDMQTSSEPSESPPETGSVSAFRRTGIMLRTKPFVTALLNHGSVRIDNDPGRLAQIV
jgi:hypothetical protein